MMCAIANILCMYLLRSIAASQDEQIYIQMKNWNLAGLLRSQITEPLISIAAFREIDQRNIYSPFSSISPVTVLYYGSIHSFLY